VRHGEDGDQEAIRDDREHTQRHHRLGRSRGHNEQRCAAGEKFSSMHDRPPHPGVVPATMQEQEQTGKKRRSIANLRALTSPRRGEVGEQPLLRAG
jgi:hypothetical protein